MAWVLFPLGVTFFISFITQIYTILPDVTEYGSRQKTHLKRTHVLKKNFYLVRLIWEIHKLTKKKLPICGSCPAFLLTLCELWKTRLQKKNKQTTATEIASPTCHFKKSKSKLYTQLTRCYRSKLSRNCYKIWCILY